MDEKSPELRPGDILPDEDQVYRIVLAKDRDRKNKKVPSVSCFSLNKNDGNKLSVDWEKLTTAEQCIARVGASFKTGTENYKTYDERLLYALDISFLNSLPEVERVVYDPVVQIIPARGRVNNPAHSLLVFNEEFSNNRALEAEILLKIRDHAANNMVEIDWVHVHELVKTYRLEQESIPGLQSGFVID